MTNKEPSLSEMGITFIGGSGKARDFKRADVLANKTSTENMPCLHPLLSQETKRQYYLSMLAQEGIDNIGA